MRIAMGSRKKRNASSVERDDTDRLSSRRRRTILTALLLLLIASIGTFGSWAAWVASDSNSSNTFSTASVLIDDNQGDEGGSTTNTGDAIFNVSGMDAGGPSNTQCIGVDFTNPIVGPATMTLSASLGGAGAATLESQLTMNVAEYNTTGAVSVTPGSDTNHGNCASYPGGANTTIGLQGSTLQNWAAAGPYSVSNVNNTWYQFTVSGLPAGDTNCAVYCGQTITIQLSWSLTTS